MKNYREALFACHDRAETGNLDWESIDFMKKHEVSTYQRLTMGRQLQYADS